MELLELGDNMNRTCGRCGYKDDVFNMRWQKLWKTWVCKDRQACTTRLYAMW